MSTLNDTAITTLGRKIKTARAIADMKQEDLARYVGVSRSAVGQWEKDETEPSALKLIAIARATAQPLGWFAEGLSDDAVRPKRLELPTFCSVAGRLLLGLALAQAYLDADLPDYELVPA